MKTKIFFLTGFACIISGLLYSQPGVTITDYRDAYIGSYFCTCICQGVDTDISKLTSHTDTTTLYITKNQLDSILNIEIGHNLYQVKLKNGIIYAYPFGRHWGGRLSANNISFGLSESMTTMCKYKGKKKSSKISNK